MTLTFLINRAVSDDSDTIEFMEKLPPQCPPADAEDRELDSIYRYVASKEVDLDAFKSHAALGKPCPIGVEPCRWASCSLKPHTNVLTKLPALKDLKWAAKLKIPKGAGRSKMTKNHVDFWCTKGFDLTTAVLEVVKVDG